MKSKCAWTYCLLEAWNNVQKKKKKKQLEYDKKQTYCLLEVLRDHLFSFQLCFFNSYKKKIPILDKKKKNQNLNWKKLI